MKEKRGSILDLFLIFLFLLCIVGGLLRRQELRTRDVLVATAPYTLTVVTAEIDPRVAECIAVGEAVYTESGELFGRVTAKTLLDAEVSLLSDGEYLRGAWDASLFVDLSLEIEIEAAQNDRGLLWNATTPLSLGETLTLYSERTALRVKLYKMLPVAS